MTRYKQLKDRFKKIDLGVVKLENWYQVYFLKGMRKGEILSNVASLDSLEKLANINHA